LHTNGAGRRPIIDVDFVRELIDVVDNSGIDTLEISRAGVRIRISKTPPITTKETAPASAAAPASAPAVATAAATPQTETVSAPGHNYIDVKSPMVGTFYRAPAPEAPPYVEMGSPVSKGQTLCILEAMKLMNELESEVDGTVREVLVENADPVEYGQVLFRIEPHGS
jgi:acetyl-CoA carboxylase biotin carboxyl carrier protein